MSDDQALPNGRITTRTLIPLGRAVAAAIALVGVCLWMESRFSQIEIEIEKLRLWDSQNWTVSDMSGWAFSLQQSNIEWKLVVPPVANGKILRERLKN